MIYATADSHFCEHSRWTECIRIHDWIAARVEQDLPALFLHAGDLYDRTSTPTERAAVAAWVTRIANVCPILIVRGNHDRPLDCDLLSRLRAKHPILVEERAAVHYIAGYAVGAIAWPNAAYLGDTGPRAAYEAMLLHMGAELAQHNGPYLIITHAMLDGARTSLGQPLIGAEMNVPASMFSAQAPLTIVGHIHAPQSFENAHVLYCGSPFRTAFGETEEKSIVRVETNHNNRLFWDRIITPAQPMILIDGESDIVLSPEYSAQVEGADVRLRYKTTQANRERDRRYASESRAALFKAGAVSVKIEERVEVEVRARAPEISIAQTIPNKLRAMWASRGTRDEVTENRLINRLGEL